MPQSAANTFIPWRVDHRAVILAIGMVIVGLILGRGHLKSVREQDRWLRFGVGGLLAGSEGLSWLVEASQGRIPIPFQLCDLALMLTVWALLSPQPMVTELAYFWGLCGSLQAILTPDLHAGFPSYIWFHFFITHGGILLSAVYLGVTGRLNLTRQSVWRVWVWTNGYALLAGFLNWVTGANFGYLARKPLQPSLLDYFGPWPIYIAAMEVVAVISFILAYAPLAFVHRRREVVRGGHYDRATDANHPSNPKS